jgi:glyoxylase I family protein
MERSGCYRTSGVTKAVRFVNAKLSSGASGLHWVNGRANLWRLSRIGGLMRISALDHVSLVTTDLDRSIAFYRDVLGLHPVQRPAFKSKGAWMGSGTLEIHLTINPDGHLRPAPHIDTGDIHFAARVADFAAMTKHLASKGYSETLPDGDPKRLVFRLGGPAPYSQCYLLDPDNHLIEINDAPVKVS